MLNVYILVVINMNYIGDIGYMRRLPPLMLTHRVYQNVKTIVQTLRKYRKLHD